MEGRREIAALRDASLRIESGIWFFMKRFGGCFALLLLAFVGSESSMLHPEEETEARDWSERKGI